MTSSSSSDSPAAALPSALLLAAVLVAVQGTALVGLALLGLLDLATSRVEVGVSVAVFFAAYGGVLLACAWALARRRTWARGPVLITQLLQLGIAWNARDNLLLALLLAATAVAVVAAVVRHPEADPEA